MELCRGGDLHDFVSQRGCLTEPEAALVFLELLQCLGVSHSRGIMHRDIKPENVLLASQKRAYPIRLGDFGVATFFDPSTVPPLPLTPFLTLLPHPLFSLSFFAALGPHQGAWPLKCRDPFYV